MMTGHREAILPYNAVCLPKPTCPSSPQAGEWDGSESKIYHSKKLLWEVRVTEPSYLSSWAWERLSSDLDKKGIALFLLCPPSHIHTLDFYPTFCIFLTFVFLFLFCLSLSSSHTRKNKQVESISGVTLWGTAKGKVKSGRVWAGGSGCRDSCVTEG